ncbi:MAG: amidohydrolase family protein [Planctomycetota bacterium]
MMRLLVSPRLLAIALLLSLTPVLPAQLAIRGGVVHPVSGPPIEDAVILVRDGKIAAIGPAASVEIPAGFRVLRAAVVTPGLVDAHSVVGLAGILNRNQDQEQLDRSAPVQPELRALDAYNPRERLVRWLLEHGVTTVHTGNAPGALVSGQSMVAKTRAEAVDVVALRPSAMVLATLGDGAREGGGKSPGTRAKMAALLRTELLRAKDYAAKRAAEDESKRPARDLKMEALAEVVTRKRRLLVTAHRDRDILTALRIAKEFGLDIVLDGASEIGLVLEEVKAAGIPVILHPPMARTSGEAENASFGTAAALAKAGVRFSFQSGYESYVPKTRVVLFEAAIAAAHGLDRGAALRAITLDAARICGVDDRVGSLEVGKDADLVLFDGDPFEYLSHVVGVVVDGRVESEVRR